jgi:hypothetical protein
LIAASLVVVDPGQGLFDGEERRLLMGLKDGEESHDAVVRHGASTASDRDRSGDVSTAFAAAGQGRHEVPADLESLLDGELSAVLSN